MTAAGWVTLGLILAAFAAGAGLMHLVSALQAEILNMKLAQATADLERALENQKKIGEAADVQVKGMAEEVAATQLPPADGLGLLLDAGLGRGAPAAGQAGAGGGGPHGVAGPEPGGSGKA